GRWSTSWSAMTNQGVWRMPTSGNMINILRMGGFSPWWSGLLDHGTPGTTKSVRFLESTEDPGVPSDSGHDWQRSRDQWKWCVPISIM
ncbi:Uncharacterized protein APZ42_000086, partial [Daphnia magna]